MDSGSLLLKTHSGRLQLLFLLLLGSLYLPFHINSLFIGLFVLLSFFTKGFSQNIRSGPLMPLLLVITFFLVNAVSLFYTENMVSGLAKLETKLSFLLMPVAIAGSGLYRSAKFRRVVLNTFLWISVVAAIAALINAGLKSLDAGSLYKIADDQGTVVKQYYFTYTHLAFFIMHPGYFSLYISSAIFIGIHLLLTKQNLIKNKWIQVGVLIFLFIFLILLQGRISILAFMLLLFVGVLAYFFSSGSYLKGIAMIAFPAVLIAAVLIFAPPSVTRRFTEFQSLDYDISAPSVYDFNGFTIRLAEWHGALGAIQEKPVVGYGLGDGTKALMESYEENNFVVGLDLGYNSHNQYLETMLQTGLVGLISLLAIFMAFIFRGYRQKDLLLFLLSSLFFLSMLTESMLERHWAISFFCSLLLYLCLSSYRELQAEQRA